MTFDMGRVHLWRFFCITCRWHAKLDVRFSKIAGTKAHLSHLGRKGCRGVAKQAAKSAMYCLLCIIRHCTDTSSTANYNWYTSHSCHQQAGIHGIKTFCTLNTGRRKLLPVKGFHELSIFQSKEVSGCCSHSFLIVFAAIVVYMSSSVLA